MSFVHSKFGRLFINQYDMSLYFNDFTLAEKAGVDDTTVYTLGAKAYISGIREGTLSAKGFYDSTANVGTDAVLENALGNGDQAISFSPNGVFSPGARLLTAIGIESDYSIMNPVANVVNVQAAFTADGGLGTGISLHDPAVAETTATTYVGQTGWQTGHSSGGVFFDPAAVTVGGGYGVFHLKTLTGTGSPTVTVAKIQHSADITTATTAGSTTTVINVASTTGYAATGVISFVDPQAAPLGGSALQLSYSAITATTVTLDTAITAAQVPGVGVTVHSASTTWVDLVTFAAPFTTAGYSAVNIAAATSINPWFRSSVTTTGTTVTACNYLTTLVRF